MGDVESPIQAQTPVKLLNVVLHADQTWSLPLPPSYTCLVYVRRGPVGVGSPGIVGPPNASRHPRDMNASAPFSWDWIAATSSVPQAPLRSTPQPGVEALCGGCVFWGY